MRLHAFPRWYEVKLISRLLVNTSFTFCPAQRIKVILVKHYTAIIQCIPIFPRTIPETAVCHGLPLVCKNIWKHHWRWLVIYEIILLTFSEVLRSHASLRWYEIKIVSRLLVYKSFTFLSHPAKTSYSRQTFYSHNPMHPNLPTTILETAVCR